MGTRWYQLVANDRGATHAYEIRRSLKEKDIVKPTDIVIQAVDKTLIRINDKKLSELNEWVQGVPKKSFTEYTRGQVPSDGNTAWSLCGWRMMLGMQKMHEAKCKECITVAKDRRNGSDVVKITASGDITIPTVKGHLLLEDQPSLHTSMPVEKKSIGRRRAIATKYGSVDSGIRQVVAQKEIADIFDRYDSSLAQEYADGHFTKTAWEEVRDEALKLHNHAIEEIKRIEEEEEVEQAKGKLLLAEFESKMGPVMEIMEQYKDLKERFG